MLNSNERMQFINEYMAAYEAKIKLANKNGLFDGAKLFELFTIEVCNLWFNQKFINLNVETSNYPYVDLISDDNKLLIQVSSVIGNISFIKKDNLITTNDIITKAMSNLDFKRNFINY